MNKCEGEFCDHEEPCERHRCGDCGGATHDQCRCPMCAKRIRGWRRQTVGTLCSQCDRLAEWERNHKVPLKARLTLKLIDSIKNGDLRE